MMSSVAGPPAGQPIEPTTIDDAAHAAPGSLLKLAKDVLRAEASAIEALASRLDRAFLDAVAVVEKCTGRVVVTGIGKSGHIARKIAATLASTGTPAFFVHAAEASHGDLGMIRTDDVVIALSNSGETAELVAILALLKRQGAKLVAITGRADSTLGREADVVLDASVATEAGPLALAPTSSTTAALALGDALALALLHLRGFDAEDFARAHPGGALGRKLLVRISDVMHSGDALPTVPATATLAAALLEMSRKRLGMTAIVNDDDTVAGVYTDGDLRRTLESGVDIRAAKVGVVMTRNPHTIGADKLAVEGLQYMERFRITGLLVVDNTGRLVGAFNLHDLFRAGVV
jgi:arabinose-5-phosphate isomerase